MDKMIDNIEYWYKEIFDKRNNISELMKKKAEMKASLWSEAEGTVDAKKDYIKSKTASIDDEIRLLEANIEYAYNMVEVWNLRLMYNE